MTSPRTQPTARPFDHFLRRATAIEIADEHRQLDLIFAEVCERARSGDWRECDAFWDEFTSRVELHMRLEEELVFPEYRQESADAAHIVDGLQAEHNALRARLFQLGVDIQLHFISARQIEEVVAVLRAHALREDETLHPWLAAHETQQVDEQAH